MPPNFSRLAYVAEFLLTLIAVMMLWSQVGGQGHLDLMPWYAKLTISLLFPLAVVGGTIAAVRADRPWNGRTLSWAVAALLIAAGMAALTYYYHLHEEDEELQESDTVAAGAESWSGGTCALRRAHHDE